MQSGNGVDRSKRIVGPRSADEGFAIAVVIWVLGLVAALTFGLVVAARVAADASSLALAAAKAQMAADGAVMLAIEDLLASSARRDNRVFPMGDTGRTCTIAGADLRVTVMDEGGKVDLNAAPERLLAALLLGLGLSKDRAQPLAAAIVEYRGSNSKRSLEQARAAYAAVGRRGPKTAPFVAVEEIGQVLGFDDALATALLPHITVHSESAGVDSTVAAEPTLVAIERGVAQLDVLASGVTSGGRLPAEFAASSTNKAFAIEAAATTPTARFTRHSVVVLSGAQGQPYRIASWVQGPAAAPADPKVPPTGC